MALLLAFVLLVIFLMIPPLPWIPTWLVEIMHAVEQDVGFDLISLSLNVLWMTALLLAAIGLLDRYRRHVLRDDTAFKDLLEIEYRVVSAVSARGGEILDLVLLILLPFVLLFALINGLMDERLAAITIVLWVALLIERHRKDLPAAPARFSATPGRNQITLSWQPGDSATARYVLKQQIGPPSVVPPEAPSPLIGDATKLDARERRLVDITLRPGAQSYYWLYAVNRRGQHSRPAAVLGTSLQRPPQVTGFLALPQPDRIALQWELPRSPLVASARLVRHPDHPPIHPDDGTVLYEGWFEACDDASVDNQQAQYYYAVFTCDDQRYWSSPRLLRVVPIGDIIGDPDPDALPDRPGIPPEEVRMVCPVCQWPIAEAEMDTDAIHRCNIHTTAFVHRECWEAVGGCPILGCPNGPHRH